MGFSAIGLIVGLAVLAPNMLLVVFPPRTRPPAAHVPLPLGWTERAGQVLCLVVSAITRPGEIADWWVIPVCAGLAGYYALWGRYLISSRAATTLYRPWWILPVPMAVLPVVVFLSAAAWLSNIWIGLAAVILAIGHIPASAIIARSMRIRP